MLEIINGVLDLSKLDAGKVELYLDSFNLQQLIETTCFSSRPLIEENNNRLIIDCDHSVGEIHSDEIKVHQILLNLLSNAGKFTENGTIRLACRKLELDSPVYQIIVSDTGIGITDEQISRLFVAYQQIDNTSWRNTSGTGLGLVITQRICQMLGGNISVHSIAGQGTEFTVILPVHAKTD